MITDPVVWRHLKATACVASLETSLRGKNGRGEMRRRRRKVKEARERGGGGEKGGKHGGGGEEREAEAEAEV